VLAVMLCYAVTLMILFLVGQQLNLSIYYYIGLMLALVLAIYHYWLIRHRDRKNCFRAFLGNNWFGFFVFAGMLAHYLQAAAY